MGPNYEHQLSFIIQAIIWVEVRNEYATNLNANSGGRPYRSMQTLQDCFYIPFIRHFFSVSWLFCFSIFRKLGPGSALGEKEKKIGVRQKKLTSEASPPVVWVGKRWRCAARPPSPAHTSAPFASRHIFFLFYPVFCLFPHFGASSRTNFLLKL